MSFLMGTPQVPSVAALPTAVTSPTAVPTPNDPDAMQAATRVSRQNAARLGGAATILTSPSGLTSSATSGGRTLLGS